MDNARLFGCTERNVNLHVTNIYSDGELAPSATQKKTFQVQREGERAVRRAITAHNLDVILSVGYRFGQSHPDRAGCATLPLKDARVR